MADRLNPNDELREGQSITSNNGAYTCIQQDDGNLVVYRTARMTALWASGTNGRAVSRAIMQTDGNLVVYGFNEALWASNTAGNPNSLCIMQDDGNLVIYQDRGGSWAALWASGTDE